MKTETKRLVDLNEKEMDLLEELMSEAICLDGYWIHKSWAFETPHDLRRHLIRKACRLAAAKGE